MSTRGHSRLPDRATPAERVNPFEAATWSCGRDGNSGSGCILQAGA
jgi:hypothetical protein